MIRIEQPTELTAGSFDATVLISAVTIRIFLTRVDSAECYFFRSVRHSEAVDQGLTQAFFLLPELAYPYHSLRVLVDYGSSYVLVPDDFLRQGTDATSWLSSNRDLDAHPIIVPLPDLRCSIVYSLPKDVFEFCNRSFVVPQFDHPLRSTIEVTVRGSRLVEGCRMAAVLYFDEGYVDIVVASQGMIRLCNRYPFRSDIDILYYITSVWRQQQMTTERDHLYLYGSEGAPVLISLLSRIEHSIPLLHLNDYSLLISPDAPLGSIRQAEPHLPASFIFTKSL